MVVAAVGDGAADVGVPAAERWSDGGPAQPTEVATTIAAATHLAGKREMILIIDRL
jgi:hypothetical protein